MSLTAGNFVFLGDYVDRGMSCLEVVAYLLTMKLMLPQKVFLLRGNHETRDVNGWEEHYGSRSFIYQCRERFGDELGYKVWEMTNSTFDRMPLAAVIDQDIFCVHGGIPRPVQDSSVEGGRIKDILNVNKVAGINPPYEHEAEDYQQVASDCIWSDPASDHQESASVDRHTGYGDSLRGGGAICFGHKAVTNFLKQQVRSLFFVEHFQLLFFYPRHALALLGTLQGFSYIMRAHEAHAEGVAVSKGARVFTVSASFFSYFLLSITEVPSQHPSVSWSQVFSTSKDHNQGNNAMAGCILIDFEKMQVINRSPAYRNQYVHRRDSVSLAMLSTDEIAERVKLGLIEGNGAEDEEEDGFEEEEEWEEFDENGMNDDDMNTTREELESNSSEEEEYVIDDRRKSSVEPSRTMASPPGSSHDNHEFDVKASGILAKNLFSGVDSSDRRKNSSRGTFDSIAENDEDSEESTVNGEDSMEPFDDSENYEPGANSTAMSPALKKINL